MKAGRRCSDDSDEGGIFTDHFIANNLESVKVKAIVKVGQYLMKL